MSDETERPMWMMDRIPVGIFRWAERQKPLTRREVFAMPIALAALSFMGGWLVSTCNISPWLAIPLLIVMAALLGASNLCTRRLVDIYRERCEELTQERSHQ